MGFSGGGSNILKPHTHDGNIAQDGGALNMDGVTQGSLTAGDLVFSDGANLQRLAIGGSGQSLTSSGSAPQWSAASGAVMELIDYTRVTANTTTIDTTFTNIDGDDMTELYCVTSGGNGGFSVGLQIRDQAGTLLTGSDYSNHGYTIVNGTQTIINSAGATESNFQVVPSTIEPHLAIMHVSLGRVGGSGVVGQTRFESLVCGSSGVAHIGGYNNISPRITGISGLKLGVSANDAIENGTYFAIYKLNP
jgi:hypothetical protein